MSFQIHALSEAPFAPLFEKSDDALAHLGARRVRADSNPGFPCRVSLADAGIGEEVLLLNHTHLPETSPYRASHAIYVRRGAEATHPAPGTVPAMLAARTLALRGFGDDHLMKTGDLVAGEDLAGALDALFADPDIAYAHVHFAARGCFAAKVTRVG